MAAVYARVSTNERNMAMQTETLAKAGCARLFEDTASGAKADRPGLKAALDFAREGDVLTVWKLDRFGRSDGGIRRTVETGEARNDKSGSARLMR
jgi:DNA invertase Pin-like site-specific DNA recombinase